MASKPKIWGLKRYSKEWGRPVLVPSTYDSEAWLERINADRAVLLDPRQPRNGKHHNLYWAILAEVARQTERYKDGPALHEAILFQMGMCEKRVIVQPNGNWEVTWDRDSTAFDNMDQAAFNEYFEKAMAMIETDIGFDVQGLIERWKQERGVK